jgi:terminase small subunit / prophage DNA-packing protein
MQPSDEDEPKWRAEFEKLGRETVRAAILRGQGFSSDRKRELARGGQAAEVRAKLREAQVDLANTRAAKMRGELIDASDVEKLWSSKLRALRNRILGIPHKVQYLSARQTMVLTQELRDALNELADDAA